MDLSRRSTLPEEMDSGSTSAEDYARCLSDLAKLNRVTFTHRPALRWLARATRDLPPGAGVSILDVACGDGDLLRAIHSWAVRRGLKVTLEAVSYTHLDVYKRQVFLPSIGHVSPSAKRPLQGKTLS